MFWCIFCVGRGVFWGPQVSVVISECTTLQGWIIVCVLDLCKVGSGRLRLSVGGKTPSQQTMEMYFSILSSAKQGGLKNALKSALFPFRTVSKLILLPYKATDFAINDRYFINRDEFSTRAHKNDERVCEFVCLLRRLFVNFLPWSRVVSFYFCPVVCYWQHAGLLFCNQWSSLPWSKLLSLHVDEHFTQWCLKVLVK